MRLRWLKLTQPWQYGPRPGPVMHGNELPVPETAPAPLYGYVLQVETMYGWVDVPIEVE